MSVLFAFTRFYLRVLADENEIILRLNQNVILKKAISTKEREEVCLNLR
jgi:hypothetical protein